MARQELSQERRVGALLLREATQRLAQGHLAVAQRVAERSLEAFEKAMDMDGMCAASSLVGRVHVRAGRLDQAQDAYRWSLVEAQRRGLEVRELSALTDLGALAELRGDLTAAVSTHRQVLERQRQCDENIGIAIAAGNVGRLLPRLTARTDADGLRDEARRLLTEAMQRFEHAGNLAGVVNCQICLGDLERAAGDLAAAETAFAQAASSSQGRNLSLHAAAVLNLGHVLRDRGLHAQARALFEQSRLESEQLGDVLGAARATLARAMAADDTVSLPDRIAEFGEVEALFARIDQPGGLWTARVNRAGLLCRLGRLPQADALLADAQQAMETAGDRLAMHEIVLGRAELALTRGLSAEMTRLLALVPTLQCPPRIRFRRELLVIRVAARSLRVQQAYEQLQTLTPASESERFSQASLQCELAGLLGDPSTESQLVSLRFLAQDHPRKHAVALLQQADFLSWCGLWDEALMLSAQATELWQARGEPLLWLRSRMVTWTTQLLCSQNVDIAEIMSAITIAQSAQAGDLLPQLQVLHACALRDESKALATLPRLDASANAAAALVAAQLADAMGLGERAKYEANQRFGRDPFGPAWWKPS